MELVRSTCRALKRSKCLQIILVLGIFVCIYFYYNIGSHPKVTAIRVTTDNDKPSETKPKTVEDALLSVSQSKQETYREIDVMITFTKADGNGNLQTKFRTTVNSLFRFSSVPINLYILGDAASEGLASNILKEVTQPHKYKMVHLDIDSLAKQVHEIVSAMQQHFSYKPGAYYSDSLFFLSLVSHRVIKDLHKIIMLDCDLKFNADILELYKHFEQFEDSNVMGIARDAQPVYRHNWHMYRNKHKGTRVGEPPPDGLTGFNSGVLLLHLDRMRKSTVYNSLLTAESVRNLTEKYMFKGHLGDQDFYSLISLDYEELFHVLPCNWNRQLCIWWGEHGYADVFDQYFKCEGHINIYHGNCNTPIPTLEWETN